MTLTAVFTACGAHGTTTGVGPIALQEAKDWPAFHSVGSLNSVASFSLPAGTAWAYLTRDPIRKQPWIVSAPAITNDMVVYGSLDDSVRALDLATGHERWEHLAGNEINASPLVVNGVVIACQGNDTAAVSRPPFVLRVGTGDGGIFGLDLASGAQKWYTPLHGSGAATPAAESGTVYDLDGYGRFHAIDARTGAELWHLDIGSSARHTAVQVLPDGGLLTSGAYPNLVAEIDPQRRRLAWTHTFDGSYLGFADEPLATDSSFIVGTFISARAHTNVTKQYSWNVYELDAHTGAGLWTVSDEVAPELPEVSSTVPLIQNDLAVIADPLDSSISAYTLRTGRRAWHIKTNGPVAGGFASQDGRLYFSDPHGTLWSLELSSGRILGKLDTRYKLASSAPSIVDSTLIFTTATGGIVASPLRKLDLASSQALRVSWSR